MLVEFSVANFRSIKDEVCLSLVAGQGKEHMRTHLVTPALKHAARFRPLVRSAALYGANAAGKTNLLESLGVMAYIVRNSSHHMETFPITPFKFDPELAERETSFEVMCVVEGVRYQYGFSAFPNAVKREWLYAWPRGRVQRWLDRNGKDWTLGDKLLGDKEVWKRATRSNALFLSTAVSLNSKQLRPLFDWFDKTLRVADHKTFDYPNELSLKLSQGEQKGNFLAFLAAADLAISDIRIVEKEFTPEMLPDKTPQQLKEIFRVLEPEKQVDVYLSHDATSEEIVVELNLAEESAGTQKVFSIAGPLVHALNNGKVLVIDELNNSLHPALVKSLVDYFHDPSKNVSGAQLVFSTHDTSILSQDTFRRDQVWFLERNLEQETKLFSLAEFRPRKGVENLERSYLSGRYGAIPYIRHFSFDSDL